MASPLASLGILGTILAGAQLGYGAVKRALRVSSAIRDISPTQAVAGNIVSARCYVEESLVGKDETKKVMKGVMVMYCGQLTTLLENRQAMNQFQDVSDHMGSAMSRGAFEKYEDSFFIHSFWIQFSQIKVSFYENNNFMIKIVCVHPRRKV